MLDRELEEACEAVLRAERRFDMTPADDGDLIEAVILELRAAELRLNALIRKRKAQLLA